MNSNLLFFLQAIQETGSISETARQLYVTQPYVSRIIKEAEKKYDVTLLVREHHPITLTIAGRKLLEYLRSSQQLQKNMQREMAALTKHQTDYLTICTNASFGHDWYAEILQHYLAKQPNTVLKTVELPYQEAEKQLRSGMVDVVIDKPINDEQFKYLHIVDFSVLLIIPANSPIYRPNCTWRDYRTLDLKQLNNQSFINVNDGSSFQQMVDTKLLTLNIAIKPTLQVTNLQTATILAFNQLGITFAPDLVLRTSQLIPENNVNIIRMPREVMFFDFGVNVPQRMVDSPLIKSLVSAIKETIQL